MSGRHAPRLGASGAPCRGYVPTQKEPESRAAQRCRVRQYDKEGPQAALDLVQGEEGGFLPAARTSSSKNIYDRIVSSHI